MHSARWHEGTLADLEALARSGDTWAMRRVSDMYQRGLRGAPVDVATAASWMEHAARAGSARAALRLAARYAAGAGVPKNLEWSFGWFRVAAQGGLMDAQVHVASTLLERDPNDAEGLRWMQQAAALGQPYAKHSLSVTPEQLRAQQAAFLTSSLEEMAAGAPDDVDTLEASLESRGPLARIGDALAAWVAELAANDPDVEVRASRDDSPVDFPGTAAFSPSELDDEAIEVTIELRWFGTISVQVGHDGDAFTISVSGSAPYPSQDQARHALERLRRLLG